MTTSPYAMVQIATEAYNGLYRLGWIITDRYEAGWVHMEPPFFRVSAVDKTQPGDSKEA